MDYIFNVIGLAGLVFVLAAVSAVTAYLAVQTILIIQRVKRKQAQTHALWVTSPFEEENFDENTIEVDFGGIPINAYLGLNLSKSEVVNLSGAPSRSKITVKYKTAADWLAEGTGVDDPPPGVYFYVAGPLIDSRAQHVIGIGRDSTGAAEIYIKDVFFADNAPAGLAGRMLVRIVRTAIELGIPQLRLMAAGGRTWPNIVGSERWAGYGAWPGYGFDMPLEPATKSLLPHFAYEPPDLGSCYTVQDVLARSSGREFWRVVGDGWFMTFDAANPQTAAVTTLLSRVREKGV